MFADRSAAVLHNRMRKRAAAFKRYRPKAGQIAGLRTSQAELTPARPVRQNDRETREI
jgi:hypothetical protein